jgi:Pvc16 N-terminal domain
MSKSQAIAAVTSMLAHVVNVSTGADVKLGRPTAPNGNDPQARKVQIFLYQVTPNAAWRNMDLPTRDRSGQRIAQRPQIALDLHYLFSFYGDEEMLEPQLMMGQVVRDLHARAIFSHERVLSLIEDISDSRQTLIKNSQIAQSSEIVKLSPSVLTLDDMFKLWSVFSQTPYVLSVAYLATVVLIEGEETEQPALPVLQRGKDDRGVETLLPPFPSIEAIYFGLPEDKDAVPRPLSYPAAKLDSLLIIKGQNLSGESVRVRFTHQRLLLEREEAIAAGDISADAIKLLIPSNPATASADWAAGMYSLKVIIKRAGSDREYLSNELPIAFSPSVTGITPANPVARDLNGDVQLELTVKPDVLPQQSAILYLADREVAAAEHHAATDTLTFVINDAPIVQNAILRLRVDGVDSLPVERQSNPERLVFADNQKVTIQ